MRWEKHTAGMNGSAPFQSWWRDPAKLFLLIGLMSGLTLLMLLPPFQVADEWRHFYRAYLLAEGRLFGNGLGDEVPNNLQRLTWETEGFFGLPTREPKPWQDAVDFLRLMAALRIDAHDVGYVSFPTVLYAPVPYLGMSAGIACGRWWTQSPLILMYLGRLGGLLLALGLTFHAIRLVPFGRWAFFLIAMTPVISYQRAGMSADGFINALAMFHAALVLECACVPGRKIGTTDIVRLGVTTVALCLCKQAYLPLALLNWVIPAESFLKPSHRRLVRYWLPALGWATAGWWATLVMNANYTPMIAGCNAKAQLGWIAAHPGPYLSILIHDLAAHGYQYLHELIGTLGWLDLPATDSLVLMHTVLLAAVSIVDADNRVRLTFFIRGWSAVVFLLSLGLVLTLMYLWWAPVGSGGLPGMQGRYFTPLLSLLPIFFSYPLKIIAFQQEKPPYHSVTQFYAWSWSIAMGGYALFLAGEMLLRVVGQHYR